MNDFEKKPAEFLGRIARIESLAEHRWACQSPHCIWLPSGDVVPTDAVTREVATQEGH